MKHDTVQPLESPGALLYAVMGTAPEVIPGEAPSIPYTMFSKTQQNTIISLVAFATLASPLTAVLYLPLLPRLAAHFSVSIQAINLTITAYIICQAIAPLLLSTHSDTFGRRPVYLASFTLFAAASLGLSLNQNSYPGLVTLRAMQSLGASAVLSIGYGVVADIRPSSSRGKVLGTILACSNLGTAVGPMIGGAIASREDTLWWAFWTMFIFSCSMLVALAILLPETARNVVGNGSIKDSAWNRPLYEFLVPRTQRDDSNQAPPRRRLAFKSPMQAILIMRHPDVALTLWIVGSFYALWYTIQASIPIVFSTSPYSFSELDIGLCYLPGAAGVVVAMYITGRVMDHNYNVLARHHQQSQSHQEEEGIELEPFLPTDSSNENSSISTFPIERARSRFSPLTLMTSTAFSIGYGWSVHTHVHPAVPLVFQFFLGFLCTWMTNIFNTLLVDIFPESPSTASTSGNLIRCGFSASAVAILDPFTRATNRGWFFTIMGVLSGVFGLASILLLNHKGMKWRRRRLLKNAQ